MKNGNKDITEKVAHQADGGTEDTCKGKPFIILACLL